MSSMGSVPGTLGKITRHVIEEKGRNIFLNGSLVPDILNWINFLPNRTESLNVQNFDIRDFIDWPFDHFDSETVQYMVIRSSQLVGHPALRQHRISLC